MSSAFIMEASGRGGGGRSSGGRGRVSGRGRGRVDSGRGTAAAASVVVGGVKPHEASHPVTLDATTPVVDGTTTEAATTTTTTTATPSKTTPSSTTPATAIATPATATATPATATTTETPTSQAPLSTRKEEEKVVTSTPPVPVTVEGLQKALALERKRSFDMHTHLSGQIHALRMELGARDRTIYYLERRLADVSYPPAPYSHWMNQSSTSEQKTDPPNKSTPKTPTANIATSNDKGLGKREAASMAVHKPYTTNIHSSGPPANRKSNLKQQQQQKEKEKETAVLTFRQIQWNKRFDEIVAFKEVHGHCNAPAGGEYAALATWVYSQRCKHKQMMEEGKESGLHLVQIRRLRSIGFTFQKPKTGQLPFDQRMQQLLAFKAKTGHCNVPQNATDCPQGLPNFVQEQRKYYNFFKRGKKCSLTQERIDRLNVLGFQWSLRGSQTTRSPRKKRPKNASNNQDREVESEDDSHEESEIDDDDDDDEEEETSSF